MPLTGFITDTDLNTIKIDENNVRLLYVDKNVGQNKELIPDPKSGYNFELTGLGSENYVLDISSLPTIQGDILQRPVAIDFYPVIKVYDGTVTVPHEQLRYTFQNTSDTQSGMVYGSDENRPVLTIDKSKPIEIIDGGIHYTRGLSFQLSGNTAPHSSSAMLTITSVSSTGSVTGIIWGSDNYDYYDEVIDPNLSLIVVDGHRRGDTFSITLPSGASLTYNPEENKQLNNSDGIHTMSLIPATDTVGAGLKLKVYFKRENRVIASNPVPSNNVVASDFGKVQVSTNAVYSSANASDKLIPLIFSNYILTGPESDITHDNYKIQSISGWGMILRKPIIVNVTPISRVYDGTRNIQCQIAISDGPIGNDDVKLQLSEITAQLVSKDVNNSQSVINASIEIPLVGIDASNYTMKIGDVNTVKITKRDVACEISSITFVHHTGEFQIVYNLTNVIGGDDVNIDTSRLTIEHTDKKGNAAQFDIMLDNQHYNSNIHWVTAGSYTENDGIVHTPETGEYYITATATNGISHNIYDGDRITIKNIQLAGSDATNYNLTTTEASTLVSLLNIH